MTATTNQLVDQARAWIGRAFGPEHFGVPADSLGASTAISIVGKYYAGGWAGFVLDQSASQAPGVPGE